MTPVDFLAVGPQRTATSWLYEVLSHHPQICFPTGVKETMFFDLRYGRGWDYYDSHFQHLRTGQIIGEIAPSYFHSEAAMERIAASLPACKILINVRNPITRSHSLFRHHLSKGRVRNSFAGALEKMPEIIESGKYAKFGSLWEEIFGAANVCYLVQEDIQNRPGEVLATVCEFLGLSTMAPPAMANLNVNSASAPRNWLLAKLLSSGASGLRSMRLHWLAELGKSWGLVRMYQGGGHIDPMTAGHIAELKTIYDEDIRWLEHRLGRNFDSWREPNGNTP